MKKSILIISAAVACAVACGFGACSCKKSGNSTRYENLNNMLNANYSEINLTVTNTFDESTFLTSEYIINYYESAITVEYTVERFSSLSIDDPSIGYKYVLSGEAYIENGEVTGGEEVGINATFANPKFNFKEQYFVNAVLEDVYFQADVKNAAAFLGYDISCTDMKIYAVWLNGRYSTIRINYAQNGVEVEYRYVFS